MTMRLLIPHSDNSRAFSSVLNRFHFEDGFISLHARAGA